MTKFSVALALLLTPWLARADGLAPNLTTTAVWQSNANNADHSSDMIGALQVRADLASTHRIALGRDDSLLIGGLLTAEAWPRFDRLDRGALGPTLAWSHKFGLGPFASVFSIELAASAVGAQESDRAGFSGNAALSLRKRLDEATRLTLSYERSRHDARALLFDRTGEEGALAVSRELVTEWSLTATVRYRRGDVLAYATPPRADLVALAHTRQPNTTFDRSFVAYSLEAHSVGGGLALTRGLGDATSVSFGYEYRNTTRQPVRYINHLVSLALTRQF